MGAIRNAANHAYRDFRIANDNRSRRHEPVKADIRALFGIVEDNAGGDGSGGAIDPVERPGDAPGAFTSALAGDGSALPEAVGTVVNNADGAAFRVAGAGTVATRRNIAIEPGKTYAVRWVFKRNTNPADPSGDTLKIAIAWLSNTKSYISDSVEFEGVVTSFAGRQIYQATISLDQPGVDYTAPSGARYVRPYIQTYGAADGTVDIEVIDVWAGNGLPGPQGEIGDVTPAAEAAADAAAASSDDAAASAVEAESFADDAAISAADAAASAALAEPTIRNFAAGHPIGLGVPAPLSAHYATLSAAQVDFPAATSLANEIAGLAAQKAADAGVYQWGAGGFFVNTTVAIKKSQFTQGKGLSPIGRGRGLTSIYSTMNAPLFTIASDTGEISGGSFGGFTHYVTGLTAGTYSATRTVSFLPSATYYIQKNAFRDMHAYGVYAMFGFNGATTTSGFGQEGRTAWNRFSDLQAWGFGLDVVAMFEYNSGSSTGNVYNGITCGLGPLGALMSVNGSAVFGDVVMEGVHVGGQTGSCVLRFNGTPAYLNNIRIAGQVDAGVSNVIQGNTTSVLYNNIDVSDLLMGGGVAWYSINTPYLVGSNIRGANSTNQQFGKQEVLSSGFGARNRPLFNVFVRSGDAVRLKLTVSGQVGGVGAGVAEWDYAFNGTAASLIGSAYRQNASANFFDVSTGVGSLTFNVNLAFADSSSSEFDAQLRVLSGRCRVQVL